MSAYNGTVVLFSLDGAKLLQVRDCTLEISSGLKDATTKDSGGWTQDIVGENGFSLSVSGIADFNEGANIDIISDLIINKTSASFQFYPQTNGEIFFYGTVNCESLSVAAPMEDVCTIDGSFKGTGVLTKGTVSNSSS